MKNWSFIRILRLVLAGVISFQAIESKTWWMFAIAALLLYQVIANQACGPCGTGSCDIPKKSE